MPKPPPPADFPAHWPAELRDQLRELAELAAAREATFDAYCVGRKVGEPPGGLLLEEYRRLTGQQRALAERVKPALRRALRVQRLHLLDRQKYNLE